MSSGDQALIEGISGRGYTGHTMLASLGLIHMNGRMYDARIGRFLSPDPHVPNPGLTQSFNRYSYVLNNPLSFIDPSGFCGEPLEGGGRSDCPIDQVLVEGSCTLDKLDYCSWLDRYRLEFKIRQLCSLLMVDCSRQAGFPRGFFPQTEVSTGGQQLQPQWNGPGREEPLQDGILYLVRGLLDALANPCDPDINCGVVLPLGRPAGTAGALSTYRYTQAGEKFIRYETANPAFSRVTPSGGVTPGTFAAPASDGLVATGQRVSIYNLPSPSIPRPNWVMLEPPAGTPIIGPRPVMGGTGNEVIFPFGF